MKHKKKQRPNHVEQFSFFFLFRITKEKKRQKSFLLFHSILVDEREGIVGDMSNIQHSIFVGILDLNTQRLPDEVVVACALVGDHKAHPCLYIVNVLGEFLLVHLEDL